MSAIAELLVSVGRGHISHTGVSLVPKVVTLNDLEQRNGRYLH